MVEKSLPLGFLATNNEAKYEALLVGMTMVNQLRGEVIEVYSVGPSWMNPLVIFLKQRLLPKDKGKVEKIRRKAPIISYPRNKSCTSFLIRGHIFCVYIPRQ